jgi:hypothetical protein
MQEFVSSFKETVRISEEARKELQRQTTEKMVSAPVFRCLLLVNNFSKSHSFAALRKPPPPPLAKSICSWLLWAV